MTRAAIGLLLLALLGGVAAGEPGDLFLDWPEVPEATQDILFHVAPEVRSEDDEEPDPPPDLVQLPLSREDVDRLLGDAVRALGGGVALEYDGIRVRGPEAALALAKRRWAAVTRFVTGRAIVTVSLFVLPPDAAATDPVALAASLAKSPERLLSVARLETTRRRTATREVVTSHPFVRRQESSVAQWSGILEPRSGVLVTGRRVAVQCRPLSSREAVVTLSLHVSDDPVAMETVDLHGGTIHLPEVRFLSVLTEMRLTAGRPEAILLPRPTGDGHLGVVVTVEDLPSDEDRPDGLAELVGETDHPAAVVLRRERRSLSWADLLKTPGFDPIGGTVPAGAGALESRLMVRLDTTRPFRLVRGTWRRTLANLDAEIAQGAAIVEPVVEDRFEGESIRARRSGAGVAVDRRTTVLLAKERRDPGVFKDIGGRRGVEAGHLLDVFRVAETASSLRLGAGENVDIGREGDRAVVETFRIESTKPPR